MRHTVPWSVKGVDQDAREAAKEAARRSGLSVGEWLNTMIAEQATDGRPVAADPGLSTVARRLETITDRLDAANRREQDTAIPRMRLTHGEQSDIVRALDAVARLAEISERRSAVAIEAVETLATGRHHSAPHGEDAAPAAGQSSAQAQLAEIARSIRALDGAPAPAAVPVAQRPAPPAPRLADRDLDATVAEIAARQRALELDAPARQAAAPKIDKPAARPVEPALAPLAERLDSLGRRMDQILLDPPKDRGPDRAAIAAEIQKLSQRIDAVNRPQGDGLERELKALSGRIEAMRKEIAARETAQTESAVAELRADIAQIASRLDELAPRRAVETLEAEIHALSERVASVRAQGIPADALETLVAEFERTVTGLTPVEGIVDEIKAVSRKLDQVRARGSDANLDRLTDEILSLREMVAGAATRQTVEDLSDKIAALTERLEAIAPPAGNHVEAITTAIEARIEEIATRLEKASRRPAPAAAANPQLEEALRRLADKLDESQSRTGDPKVLGDLERHILSLAAKIDAADSRFAQLGTIERGLSDLFVQMEEMRASTLDAAERAARGAVAELGRDGRRSNNEVEALRGDLEGLRNAQSANEERTLGSLQAVHQTLDRVVKRIAEIEPAEPRASAAPRAAQPSPTAQPAASNRPAAAPAAPPRPAQASAQQRGPRAEAAAPTVDLPLEPGSGAPRLRPPAPGSAPAGGSKADFIAAARRAAQAAAAEASIAGPLLADERPQSLLGKLKGALGRSKAEDLGNEPVAPAVRSDRKASRPAARGPDTGTVLEAAAHPLDESETAGLRARLAANRRTIIMGIAAALLVVAAGLSTLSTLRSKSGGDAGTAATPSATSPQGKREIEQAPTARQEPREVAPASSATLPAAPPAERPLDNAAPPAPAPAQGDTAPPASTGSVSVLPRGTPLGTTISPVGWQSVGGADRQDLLPRALRSAAETGNAAAAFEVGSRYLEGRGVPVSAADAATWYQRAAEGGLAPAQYRLGSLYEKGTGVPRDLSRARSLYEAAAAAGNGKAMHNLAVMFAQGAFAERPDYKTAAQWFRRAADYGIADSQYNLAILYARGLGVEQSLPDSYKWFALAAQGGDQDAAKKRDEVAGRIDPQTMVAVRLAVQTFVAKAEPDAAIRVAMPPGGWGEEPRTPAAPTTHTSRRPAQPVALR